MPVPSGAQETATTLDQLARHHIEEILTQTLGRIEGPFGAARRLGINPHTLRARMRKLGIDWRRFRVPMG
jgi:transcriptional regulator with GAF, ATPase, and Fis domain